MRRAPVAILPAIGVVLLSGWPLVARAIVDHVSLEAGAGNHVQVAGMSVGTTDWRRWSLGGGASLALYGKVGFAGWRGLDPGTEHRGVWDLSAYPVLRWEGAPADGRSVYAEASVGLNLVSDTRINDRGLGTAFLFGESIGLGFSFGPGRRYDIGLRAQHLSNGRLKRPNDGLSYGAFVFRYRFEAP